MQKPEFEKLELIDLDHFVFGSGQMRTRDVGKEIDELADNIYKVGLLNPISVFKREDGKYEIIAGQRRFLAHKKLQSDGKLDPPNVIKATISTRSLNKHEAKGLSIIENLMKVDPPEKDYIDACTDLFDKYGSIKAVAEELGISRDKVSKYVKVRQLKPSLKKLYKEGRIGLANALHANTAVIGEGDDNEKKREELALELEKMGGSQNRRARNIIHENPNVSVKQAVEMSKVQESHKIAFDISPTENSALEGYASSTGQSREDAASEILVDGLVSLGVLDEEDDD